MAAGSAWGERRDIGTDSSAGRGTDRDRGRGSGHRVKVVRILEGRRGVDTAALLPAVRQVVRQAVRQVALRAVRWWPQARLEVVLVEAAAVPGPLGARRSVESRVHYSAFVPRLPKKSA